VDYDLQGWAQEAELACDADRLAKIDRDATLENGLTGSPKILWFAQ